MSAPPTTHAGAGLRFLRAAVFAAVCVVLSGVGHAVASCATVPWWALGLAFLAVLAVAAPLAGRRRSLPGIAAALGGGQLVLHALFGFGQHTATSAAGSPADPAVQGGSDASLAALAAQLVCGGNSVPLSPAEAQQILRTAGLDPAALAAQSAHAAHGHAVPLVQGATEPATGLLTVPMLLGHLLAALAAGWLLGRGDAALLRLLTLSRRSAEAAPVRALRTALALVRALAAGLPGAPAGGAPRVRRSRDDDAPSTGRDALQHTVIRRGPPVAAYALAA
ncbi:hypothetical protein [Streptomyces antimicrobicus]|uniref:Integral membrane protein n=1 Tax=Streptomyces antimicrobicus TaxID=2883108 RepID=A0ABS8B082_9ACTN|nr:hypothetical protein [Streptomyces antimicrobicus]MCB5178018.1 hypothetical protein [Streptomyces antimicrobicus]